MLKVFKFVKLDYLLIKNQLLKALLLMLAASLIIFFTTEDISFITYYPLFFAIIVISYPFVLSEKNNMENFYATLAINKSLVVRGRYVFAMIMSIIFAAVSAILTVIFSMIKGINISTNSIIINSFVIIFVSIFFSSIQMPIYFKVGFTKARLWTYIPFLLVFPATMIIKYIPRNIIDYLINMINHIKQNAIISSMLIVLISMLIYEISMIISQNLYKSKEI